jgi:hypothetical protein
VLIEGSHLGEHLLRLPLWKLVRDTWRRPTSDTPNLLNGKILIVTSRIPEESISTCISSCHPSQEEKKMTRMSYQIPSMRYNDLLLVVIEGKHSTLDLIYVH